jgi:hypothetical protein
MAILIGSYQGLTHAETSAGFKMRWGRRTPRGLLIQTLGFIFATMGNPIGNPVFARGEHGTRHSLHNQVENAVSARYNEESGSFDPSLVHGVTKLALLILWPNDILPESMEVSEMGILVAIYEEENGVKYVKRLSTASATNLDRARDREIISCPDNGYPR